MNHRVLIVGYRTGLSDALTRLGIAHGVWHDRPLKTRRSFLTKLVRDFPRSRDAIHAVAALLATDGPFSHVIAGTEAAVYPASVLRRYLGARLSKNSIALRCHDKLLMKTYLCERGIPMTDFLPGGMVDNDADIIRLLGTPVVVKSRLESGGRNMVFAGDTAVLARHNLRGRILERYVDAPEWSIESFINKQCILFENVTQYYVKGEVNLLPAPLPPAQYQELLVFNRRVIAAMRISWGMTHLEVYRTPQGILFGEIALRPPGGYLMELLDASYGINAWDALVAMELDLPFEFPEQARFCSASCVFHPGVGQLRAVENWEQARALPAVFRSRLKYRPGQSIRRRHSVGEDVAYLLLKDSDSTQLIKNVDWVRDRLRFILDESSDTDARII